MTSIEWRDEFEIGVPGVDAEHRELVALINELPPALMASPEHPGDSGPGDAASMILGEILASISAHFALEERLMRESGYDEYQDHKADHELLLDDLRDLMDDFEAGHWVDLDRFVGRVGDWFAVHFRTRDARLHQRLG